MSSVSFERYRWNLSNCVIKYTINKCILYKWAIKLYPFKICFVLLNIHELFQEIPKLKQVFHAAYFKKKISLICLLTGLYYIHLKMIFKSISINNNKMKLFCQINPLRKNDSTFFMVYIKNSAKTIFQEKHF